MHLFGFQRMLHTEYTGRPIHASRCDVSSCQPQHFRLSNVPTLARQGVTASLSPPLPLIPRRLTHPHSYSRRQDAQARRPHLHCRIRDGTASYRRPQPTPNLVERTLAKNGLLPPVSHAEAPVAVNPPSHLKPPPSAEMARRDAVGICGAAIMIGGTVVLRVIHAFSPFMGSTRASSTAKRRRRPGAESYWARGQFRPSLCRP